MLSQDDFKPVTLEDRDFFDRHYKKYPQTHSDNTFTNMVCWNHYAHYRYAFVNNNVILASTIDGITRFRPPIGPRDPDLLKSLLRLAFEISDNEPVVLIDPDTSAWIKGICPDLNIVPDRDVFEYVYRTADLADLPGETVPYDPSPGKQVPAQLPVCGGAYNSGNREEVKRFLIEWCEWKGCEQDAVLAHEKEATFFGIDNFEKLGLSGLIIRVHSKVGAMSLFEPLNADTALVHFEKGMPECDGIYKEINTETAALLKKDFTFVNRESDLGVPGLREAKLRYHPDHMVEVYSVKRQA